MPSTALKGYEIQVTSSNSGTWGQVLNDSVIQFLDDNLAGITNLSLTNANVTLTASQARMCMLRCAGTLTGAVQITNSNNGVYLAENVTSGSFAVTLTDGVTTVTLTQSRRYVLYRDATNGIRILSNVGLTGGNDVPTGAVMLFYASSAPTGWSAVALNDYAIKIVTNGSGGVISGSIAYSTLFARTTTDGHTLTVAQIPSHTHSIPSFNQTSGNGVSTFQPTGTTASGATGGGDSHDHPLDMRVNTAAMTLYTKS